MGLLDLLEFHEYVKIAKAAKEMEKASRRLNSAMNEFDKTLDESLDGRNMPSGEGAAAGHAPVSDSGAAPRREPENTPGNNIKKKKNAHNLPLGMCAGIALSHSGDGWE